MKRVLNRTPELLAISACMRYLDNGYLLTHYCRMSDVEQQPVPTMRRANGHKKAGDVPNRAPVPSLTAEDVAVLEEESRITKIAL